MLKHLVCSFLLFICAAVSFAVDIIPDPALRQAVREHIGLPVDAPLEVQHLQQLEYLDSSNRGITDITGLEHATNLKELHISQNPITDLTPLANLIQLQELHFWHGPARPTNLDLRPLAKLTNLHVLSLSGNGITDISPLSGLTQLHHLHITGNHIADFSPLAGLNNLRELWIAGNRAKDLTPLSGMNLRELHISDNPITNWQPLMTLINLEVLAVEYSGVSDLRPLAGLTSLRELYLRHNFIEDLSSLAGLTSLQTLDVATNRIEDLRPLTGLTQLQTLDLTTNRIEDLRPLVGLTALRTLWIQENPIKDFTPLFVLNLTDLKYDAVEEPTTQTDPAAAWMPEPALRVAVRGDLGLLPGVALTKEKMREVSYINVERKGVSDLRGLEFATNLRELELSHNPITDLRPLRDLINLEELHLGHCEVSDISPLSGLENLRVLVLSNNQISDFSPLLGLTALRRLWIRGNWALDISILSHLHLTTFVYDESCIIEPLAPSTVDRIENRSFPSVYQVFAHIIGKENDPEAIALHDLYWSADFGLGYRVHWQLSEAEPTEGLSTALAIPGGIQEAKAAHQHVMRLNPNILLLMALNFEWWVPDAFPKDSDFWIRDPDGNLIVHPWHGAERVGNLLNPEYQEMCIEKVVALAACGLFDGIFVDSLANNGTGFQGRDFYPEISDQQMIDAYTRIFSGIRERVRDDFVIVANVGWSKPTAYTQHLNGVHMETGRGRYNGYPPTALKEIESILLWVEENLRAPQINGLMAGGIATQPPDSPENQQSMRMLTTLVLTHSNGFVLYTAGRRELESAYTDYSDGTEPIWYGNEHIWYDFWDADLGQPIGEKAQLYKTPQGISIDGLFIREYTNGWAVYNRSGKEQMIQLPEQVNGWESGVKNKRWHTIPDLDGEIYLKPTIPDAPRLGVSISVPSDTQDSAFDAVITFTAPVSDFLQEDLSISGTAKATITAWTASADATIYTATITPTSRGTVILNVNKNVATDAYNNQNTAAKQKTVNVEFISNADINEDGNINKADLILVVVNIAADSPSTPRADVDGDGNITVADLQLVIDNLDDKITAASPTLPNDLSRELNPELLRAELNRVGTDAQRFKEATALLQALLDSIRPEQTLLLANYPNPFNPETWIPYQLANPSEVKIRIYDTRGTIVRQLDLGHQHQGYYTNRNRAAYWDGRNDVGERVASGVYFYTLTTGDFTATRKMLIRK